MHNIHKTSFNEMQYTTYEDVFKYWIKYKKWNTLMNQYIWLKTVTARLAIQ